MLLSLLQKLNYTELNKQANFLLSADSMFLATISEESVSISNGDPIIWDSAPINPGGHFNTTLGAYTAPVHGYYQ